MPTLATVLARLRSVPLWVYIAAALVIALGVQTWRVSSWRGEAASEKAGRAADRNSYVHAQDVALAKAVAAKAAKEQEYREQAERVQHEYETELAGARSLADSYKLANRVRNQTHAGAGSGADATAQGGTASVPQGAPGDAIVVSEANFDACTAVAIYASKAYDWAQTLQ